ncbi:MAG: HAD family hydrolase [Cyanobacteria bacterium P01_E01_bin.6]
MISKRTIFCDFDGPIVDVSERYYKTYLAGLQEFQLSHSADGRSPSIQPMTKQKFWEMKQHRVPDSEIAIRSGLKEQETDSFLARVKHLVNKPHLLHYDQIQPGAHWAFKLLNKQGVRLILVTLRCQQQATQLLHEYGLLPFFSDVYGTTNIDAAYLNGIECKSALLKQAWQDHLYHYGRPMQAWMVGDTEADICAGQALGMPTVAITTGVRSPSYLKKFNPSYTFDTLLNAANSLMERSPFSYASSFDTDAVRSIARC